MTFKKSGSRYANKIDPVTIYIAYEGAVDEKKYFEALKLSIPKRFDKLVSLIPVEKSTTNSAPTKVLEDLDNFLDSNQIKLNKNNKGFIVIDKDRWDEGTHKKGLKDTITKCKQKGVTLLCSTPSFDLWLLCHFVDISVEPNEFKDKAKSNLRKTKSSKTFLKSELSKLSKIDMKALISKTSIAINNAEKLNHPISSNGNLIPDQLFTNVFFIHKELAKNKIPIL
ncbi:RloB family protein [Paraglaciecola sp.]|uniref:RloB family protein n=1 Tax=Paraglaciecola sp. TaxID=1920173 RepID=UPI0032663742